ncbi:MAG: hypothetical protein JNL82_34210 [Myxococcales bacterium]|nr:hypothetical protein [Myxococcales bacterium]
MSTTIALGGGFMSRLNPRERALLGVLLIVFFVCATGVLFYMRGLSMAEKQAAIDDLRHGLDLVYTKGTVYDLKKKEKAQREARIANTTPIIFSTLIEDMSKTLVAGEVRGGEEKTMIELGNGLTKRTYGFEVRNVPLEELLTFLGKLEQQPGHILIVDRLGIKSPSAEEDRLNVEVDLATWELQKPGAGAEAGAGAESAGEGDAQ